MLSLLLLPFLFGDGAPAVAPTLAPTTTAAVAAAPDLWFVLPAQGAPLTPVLMVGSGFGDGLPFFGIVPSVPLFRFNTPGLPFLGSLSLMVTGVPPIPFPGVVPLTVLRGLQASNAVDFRVL